MQAECGVLVAEHFTFKGEPRSDAERAGAMCEERGSRQSKINAAPRASSHVAKDLDVPQNT
jgi:hypothetical protein